MQDQAFDWVDRFVGHLTYERRLSELTCRNYRRDLDALAEVRHFHVARRALSDALAARSGR